MSGEKKVIARKVFLVGGIVLLAAVYVVQTILAMRSSEKIFRITQEFDSIVISSAENGTVELYKSGDSWSVNDSAADPDRIEELVSAVSSIKVLDSVATFSGDYEAEKYGFTENTAIVVCVNSGDKEIMFLEIGKDAAAGQQNYIKMNGAKTIYLASGALRHTFSVSSEELKAVDSDDSADDVPEQAE